MEELIEKAKNGDKEAFTKLILKEKAKLYKIAKARLKNEADIEEVIQETMLNLFIKLPKLKDNTKFDIWLYKIVRNKCNEKYRKNRISFVSLEWLENQKIYNDDTKLEDKLDYEKILEKFSHQDQMILLLYYSNGYTTKQIAEILGKNENTIKTKLRRMKEKIRKDWERGNRNG